MSGKPVIVGVDGSLESARAAAFAWRLAQAARAECRLVHVIPDTWLLDHIGQPLLNSRALIDDAIRQARGRLEKAMREAAGQEPFLKDAIPALETLEVRIGRPAAVLRDAANAVGAQWIVLGGKHHTAIGRALGGSTARDLVRIGGRPLLVVGRRAKVDRVLVAVDLSPASRPTLTAARRLARLCEAHLRVLYVVEPVRVPLTLPFTLDEAEIGRKAAAAFTRLARSAGGSPAGEWVERRGVAADAIAQEAAAWEADVVVVGSQGHGWVDRMLIGSTTERLLALLPAGVLVVPAGRRARLPRKVGTTPTARRRARDRRTRRGVAV